MITIKEIAALSGVSPSTVSKIINNKAGDISQETIDRVLEIVKKHNYRPYATVRKDSESKSLTIAVLLRNMDYTNSFIEGIIDFLNESGYSLLLYNSNDSNEQELQNISKLSSKEADGILWQPVNEQSLASRRILEETSANIIYLDALLEINGVNYSIDYAKIGYFATENLIKRNHTNIACLIKNFDSTRSQLVMEGFRQCLFDYSIPFSQDMIIPFEKYSYEDLQIHGFTAIVSSHLTVAMKIYENLELNDVNIPAEMSMISLCDDERNSTDIRNISAIRIPSYQFGNYVSRKIVSMCENKEYSEGRFEFEPVLESEASLSVPYRSRLPKIVVVGSLNIDNIIYLDEFPSSGSTEIASECISIVGGKALNQAIGVSLLKKEVSIIGKIGKDSDSILIRNQLAAHNVDAAHLVSDAKAKTGKAFITINATGESTITVAKGANNELTPEDIKRAAKAFDNAGICLLQSEVPLSALREAAMIARRHKAVTIFKPATIKSMEDEDFRHIDIFVPNRNESLLLSGKNTVEEAAEYFYAKGIRNVIITLDKDGALLKNSDGITYYPAGNVLVIDATGGSDAFISALACQLIDNKKLDYAIKVAMIAAGYCVGKFGASTSMIDYETLERTVSRTSL